MDLAIVLSIVNLVLLVAVIALVSRAKAGAGAGLDQQVLDKSLAAVRDEVLRSLSASQVQTEARLESFRKSLEDSGAQQRKESAEARVETQKNLTDGLTRVTDQLQTLTRNNGEKVAEMQAAMQTSLERMQKGNEEKLEKMRETVDEKLQGTLEKRLGESFKIVSDNLEAVQKGLGAMQTIAGDVGNLQKVLTNVKNRGGWGEAQLGAQLEDMLSPEQFEANVKTKKSSNDLVEFAIKLPGQEDGEYVYLPIDSKFPQEDYERLLAAQEIGDIDAVTAAGKEIEKTIKAQAKLIQEKYIDVPHTTDFAIMYLPTEGLFAEVIRRPGLISEIQSKHRVLISGPTTLMSLLNSLQMGFRTLAIQKNASDVWKILSAAKAEFQKYGKVWDKLAGQLRTAQNTVEEAGRRTRAVERTLRTVETGAAIESTNEFKAIESLIEDGEILDDEVDSND